MNKSEKDFVLAVCELNEKEPKNKWIDKRWRIGRHRFVFNFRPKDSLWGRFGGGWDWNLGIRIGGSTVIFDLLVCSLRWTWFVPRGEQDAE